MKKLKGLLGLLILGIGISAIIYLRFANPHMTETELFIDHWFDFLVACALLVYGSHIYLEA